MTWCAYLRYDLQIRSDASFPAAQVFPFAGGILVGYPACSFPGCSDGPGNTSCRACELCESRGLGAGIYFSTDESGGDVWRYDRDHQGRLRRYHVCPRQHLFGHCPDDWAAQELTGLRKTLIYIGGGSVQKIYDSWRTPLPSQPPIDQSEVPWVGLDFVTQTADFNLLADMEIESQPRLQTHSDSAEALVWLVV